MKTGNIILDVTHGLDIELGSLPWITVKRIVEKHISEARKELLKTAMEQRKLLFKEDRRQET